MSNKRTYGKTASGVPITDELIAKLATKAEAGYDVDETLRRRPGRPTIGTAPARVESVRLDPDLHRAITLRAERDNETTSTIIRTALREYLARLSKAHPDARHRGIGFKIADAFPTEDPIARWTTVLAMAANNTIYLNVRIIEGDLPPELNLYYFRLLAAHFFEAATWLHKTRRTWPEVNELIDSLDDASQARYDHIVAYASQKHPLHEPLRRSRTTLFHYPEMHPGKKQAGTEELANALEHAKDAVGWIEGGQDYASFRAAFADEVAVQFLAESQELTEELMETLSGPVFELVEFTEAVLLQHLKRVPRSKTKIWRRGHPRPEIK
jgi:predicted transcriptional regulator